MAVVAQTGDMRGFLGDYLRQKGINVRRHFRCLSPAHEDKHPSMSFNPTADQVHCFSCGVTYDLFDLIGMDYRLDDFPSRLNKAAELFGVKIPKRPVWRPKLVTPDSRDEELSRMFAEGDKSLEYFLSRDITEETCRKHHLFQKDGRAWFPIYRQGRCTSWCARAIDEAVQPRYKNSAGKMDIWNGDLLAGQNEVIYITEGIIDALCLEQAGKKAVALCGSQNVDKLLRLSAENHVINRRFITCGDPDDAGEKMNTSLKEGFAAQGVTCMSLTLKNKDVGELYISSKAALIELLNKAEADFSTEKSTPEITPARADNITSAADMLAEFFARSKKRAGERTASTGFTSLDKAFEGGLHAGLYVLGAISSLGKTSFLLQIADNVAAQGRDVLFFSLEQDRFELIAKSLSRISAELDGGRKKNAFTVRQLLNGQAGTDDLYRQDLLNSSRNTYEKLARQMFIHEGMADIGVTDIASTVDEHIKTRGTKPVVMVDYLQILAPADPRATDKQNVDRSVTALKRLSRDHDIPVIAVSSFNRDNYRTAVSMEAFKESGAVEYSSDVLLGMQLKGAGQRDFDVNAAKHRERRELELIMLKNRGGTPYAKIDFKYQAMFGLFSEG